MEPTPSRGQCDSEMGSRKLRIMTYLAPGLPLDFFDLFRDYLEKETGINSYIIYESRWSGPPLDRKDPFTADEADIVFMCSTAFLRLLHQKNEYMELCLAAPLYIHPSAQNRPVYFSDIIIHKENQIKFKDFLALKGCRWAYNDDISLSGNLMVLAELKKQGYNANFFGHVVKSGSHHKSLRMILDHTVDAAAIDSNTWAVYQRQFPERASNLVKLTSFGPMPVYPMVFNSRLQAKLKEKITHLLLSVDKSPDWGPQLQSFGISGYTRIDSSLYDLETLIQDLVKGLTINPAYY
ncbi:uncharacterized protein LOC112561596 isoform X2 [Pomacea canaliculata]|uniref:uncharacterized protein LOC112561596 isoform X2 n=1 Tax=Pomacea canaliculata TaxID=400727 RepID=UPI000D738C43|nr:uncharacterized protein LOC112561596 isoform X2 [Pomacea canaliculata]